MESVGRLQISRASGSICLGKYRVFASLGRGGMADVQLAASQGPKGFNKLVVVKQLRPLLAEDATSVNMFLDEARLDARLNHPNLIHTYEFGEEQGTYFIVMEFLEGQPLHEILAVVQRPPKRDVSPSIWAKIVAEALAGLHYAHELRDYDGTPLNIVHRDVSPQNIIVTYDGTVKLVDFGIAKATVNASKTESQVIKGKLAYMAPEQANPLEGIALDRRADVFAMGIVLWECLAKKRLATGDARQVMSKIIDMEFQPPSRLNPEVPQELDAITRRALERSPADRFQTAQAMREALERFLHTQGELVSETTVGALVSELFSREHEDIQRQIRVQMLSDGSSRDLTVDEASYPGVKKPQGDEPPKPGLAPAASPTESVGSLRVVRTSVRSATDTRSGRGVWIVAASVVVLLFLAAFVTRRSTAVATHALPDAPTSAAAATLDPTPARPPSPPAIAAPPEPATSAVVASIDAGARAPTLSTEKTSPPARIAPPARSGTSAHKLDKDPWR